MGEIADRERRRRESFDGWMRDVRLAVRRLAAERGFAAMALATLTLGIGAAIAMFTVVNAVVLRPLPYPESDRLVQLSPGQNFNIAFVDALSEIPVVHSTTGLSLWGLTLLGDDANRTEQITAQVVDAGWFDVFGVTPALGRGFRAEERRPDLSGVVILSDALWRNRFGADPSIVGRRIRLDGYDHESREVVGVMPRGFRPWNPSGRVVDAWIPFSRESPRTIQSDSTWYVNQLIARLAPGATVEQAAQQVRTRTSQLVTEFSAILDDRILAGAGAAGLLDSMVGGVRDTLLTLLAAVSLVVVLACANLSNLLLARGERRRQEMAVRAALGAGRLRLVREQLVESLVLALAGGALGLLFARAVVSVLGVNASSALPRGELTMDTRVVAFAFGLSLLAALGFGLLPALRATRRDVREDLGSGGRRRGGTRAAHRSRHALVAAEVALATMLVVGAGLLLNSLRTLRSVPPGLDADDVIAVRVSAPDAKYTGSTARTYYAEVLERVRALPGVRSAGAIHLAPFTFSNWAFPYLAEGMDPPAGPLPAANFRVVTPGYFDAVDQPLLAGRDLTVADQAQDAPLVGLINETFARRLWPDLDPLGRTIRVFGNRPFTVVGIVGDVHQRALDVAPEPEMYLAHGAGWSLAGMFVMIETTGERAAVMAATRDIIARIDPDVPIVSVQPLAELLGESMAQRRFFAGVLTFFGALALALGAVGVFGVTNYIMLARRPEFGVRMALGATRDQVLRGALATGLVPVLLGLGLGVAGALAGSRLLRSLLYGVEPSDPVSIGAAATLLAIVAATAAAIPALRLTRVDLARVLRS